MKGNTIVVHAADGHTLGERIQEALSRYLKVEVTALSCYCDKVGNHYAVIIVQIG